MIKAILFPIFGFFLGVAGKAIEDEFDLPPLSGIGITLVLIAMLGFIVYY